jgi:HlyD family secretion protein
MPIKSAALSVANGGIVAQMAAGEGDHVSAKQVILRLASEQQKAALAQAQARLAQAITTRDNAKRALDNATAARDNPQELDVRIAQAQTQVNTAKYQVDAARANATSAETQKDAAGGMAISPQQKVLMNQWYAAQSQLAAAQAAFDGAQNALDALLDMRLRPIALQAQVDAAKAQYDSAVSAVSVAQADLESANVVLANLDLRAPFAGTIMSLDVHVGEFAVPGNVVLRLADISQWQIETTDLTELNILNVSEGAPVTMTFDAIPGLELPGKVSKIKAYGGTRQGDIVYTLVIAPNQQDPRLRWNMTAKVTIEPR